MRMGFIVEEIDSDRPRFYGRLDVLGYNIEHAIDHMWTVREMAEVVAARFGARVGKTTIPDGCPEGVQMLEVVGFRSESDRDRFWRLLEIAQPGRTWQLHCRDLPTQREL
jgi:predicted amidohydrolase